MTRKRKRATKVKQASFETPISIDFPQWTNGILADVYEDKEKSDTAQPGEAAGKIVTDLAPLDQFFQSEDGLLSRGSSPEEEVRHLAVQAVRQAVAEGAKGSTEEVADPVMAAAMAEAAEEVVRANEKSKTKQRRKRRKVDTEQELEESRKTALIREAARRARESIPEGPRGHSFSDEESAALDVFINEYCRIEGLTLDEVKQRIWGNERRKDSFWEMIREVIPDRSRASLYKHVRRSYHVFKVRARWTPEDDERLAELAKANYGKWQFVGKSMGRMPEDCRDRWRNYVKCGTHRKTNKWDVDEQEQLIQVVRDLAGNERYSGDGSGINWTQVSDMIGNTRSRIQCRYKWKKIFQDYDTKDIDEMKGWLLLQLQSIWASDPNCEIDWDRLASSYLLPKWTGKDLQEYYGRLCETVESGETNSETVDRLLGVVTEE